MIALDLQRTSTDSQVNVASREISRAQQFQNYFNTVLSTVFPDQKDMQFGLGDRELLENKLSELLNSLTNKGWIDLSRRELHGQAREIGDLTDQELSEMDNYQLFCSWPIINTESSLALAYKIFSPVGSSWRGLSLAFALVSTDEPKLSDQWRQDSKFAITIILDSQTALKGQATTSSGAQSSSHQLYSSEHSR